ncbi:MAG TPA: LD-carboxypeptidase [Alphaproteobacteria bacterium]|nr:LD-carboxypeptidase [Alphaproteobacteria bacterium]
MPPRLASPAVFPPPLKEGGTIGIVSPARWPKREWIARGKALLEQHGYEVVVHAQNYLKEGQLAGSDAARAEAIMDMFADRTIDAIMCARGGTGSLRLLDKLDYKAIKRNPKPLVGFSDITLLLHALHRRCGFVTFHGPLLWNFAESDDPRSAKVLFAILSGEGTRSLRISKIDCVRHGHAEGVLTGGNISHLEHLMGTSYDWSTRDGILFIEDVDEPIYKIDEKLRHMRLAGRFEGVRAVIVGEMIDISDGETGLNRKGEKPYGRSLREVFLENLPPDVPLCFDFPCGHGKYITTLPVGASVRLALGKNGAELSF